MKSFMEYNKSLVTAIGLEYTKEGKITSLDGEPILLNKKEIMLPTDSNINNMNQVIHNVITSKYTIFNPYAEDDLRKNPICVVVAKFMSGQLTATMTQVLPLLVDMLIDTDGQDDAHNSIQRFIIKLRKDIGNRGKIASKNTSVAMRKYIDSLLENNIPLLELKTAKGDTIAGVKYNRTAKVLSSALDHLDSVYEELKISERNRDIIREIFNFTIPDIDNNIVGSKSTLYPSFIALMELYTETNNRLKFLLEILNADDIMIKSLIPNIPDEDIEKYQKDIDYIPNKLNRNVETPQPKTSFSTGIQARNEVVNTPVQQTQFNTLPDVEDVSDDPLDMLRNKTNGYTDRHGVVGNVPVQNQNQNGYVVGLNNNSAVVDNGNSYSSAVQQNRSSYSGALTNNAGGSAVLQDRDRGRISVPW